MSNQKLWGLTLLERNLKELEKLGIKQAIVTIPKEADPIKHFCHGLPKNLKINLRQISGSNPFETLLTWLGNTNEPVLVLEGHALTDRRILEKLIQNNSPCAVMVSNGSNQAGAAILSASKIALVEKTSTKELTRLILEAIRNQKIKRLDLTNFDPHIKNLRRHVNPYLLLIENQEQQREAEQILRQTVHKGVNDFVAKYIHPPLEFGAVRFLACTPVTPNQITILWVALSALVIPLFATGHLLLGIFLAALCGVLDGIDGKLARLTLRFSKGGDLLDHVSNTLYDGIWYLALGWYFSNGNLNSTAARFTFVLFVAYIVERIVPGIFKKVHGQEIYDYKKIDKVARLLGSRMNNNVWVLLLGIIFSLALETFYAISLWMLATAIWHTLRLFYVTWKTRVSKSVLIN
jgi:phosphatidylglycerophosphate synthase